jgi:hypothetical protein
VFAFDVWRLGFGAWRLAWKTDGARANGRYGDTAIRRYGDTAIRRKGERAKGRKGDTVLTAFEDEDDDEYEDDGFARGLA